MIVLLFGFASEKILVTIKRTQVTFANTAFGAKETSIEGLRLSQQGVIKEFPDLKEDSKWREKAIERFKEKIANFNTEKERANYIIEDLRKHGYEPEQIQIGGFRPKRIK